MDRFSTPLSFQLEFCHKESGEETSVGLVYFGKVGGGERRPEGWGTFGI